MGEVQYAPRWLYSAQKDPRGALHYQSEQSCLNHSWDNPFTRARGVPTAPRRARGPRRRARPRDRVDLCELCVCETINGVR
jgi:hypothetical protein